MSPLEQLLVRVPAVYAELGHAMLPGRAGGDGPKGSPDPRHRPAPGNLDALQHRATLVDGLRWWIAGLNAPTRATETVPRMCAWLLVHQDAMTDAEREQLQTNLWEWDAAAAPLVGSVASPLALLPPSALEQRVPVHVAAKALGVSVSTVKRRAPGRTGGMVHLRDVAGPECPMSDLPSACCAHCRPSAQQSRTVT